MEEKVVVDQNILELMNIVHNAKLDQFEFVLIQM
jgi:hypothetical protein